MTKNEFLAVFAILLVIILFALPNFSSSKVQARDVQRKNDLRHIRAALTDYFKDFSAYPRARDGKILACGAPEKLEPCEWEKDVLRDLRDPIYPPYIERLPRDPQHERTYVYISNTRNFQLLASLEDSHDREYNKKVEDRNISCGTKICNFGVTSAGDVLPEEEMPPENPPTAQ
ncbi:MAG: hypothetical protein HYW33_02175 [Candidatus Blackburnbacteria bacterium]|nr:hypothetical protein [Candidatus Blackburnbacteria bacterium]